MSTRPPAGPPAEPAPPEPRPAGGTRPVGAARSGSTTPALPAVTTTTGSSLAAQVVTAVRRAVRAGELEPGRLYSVQQLASVMQVSRSPVREGLLRLAEAGLVRFHRNRGFEIVRAGPREVAEILATRTGLEVPAARRVARMAEAHDLERLREQGRTVARAVRAGHADETEEADEALHRSLMDAAGNHQAALVVQRLWSATSFLGAATAPADAELAAVHDGFVTALAARDEEAAAGAVRALLAAAARRLVAQALRAEGVAATRVEQRAREVWEPVAQGW